MNSPITLYTTPAETLYNNPFWDLLLSVSKLNPEDTLIIVSSYKLKSLIEKKIAKELNDKSLLPSCLTLDEIIQNHKGIILEDTPSLDEALVNQSLKTTPLPNQIPMTKGLKHRLVDTLLKTFTYTSPYKILKNSPWSFTFNKLEKAFKSEVEKYHITRKPDAYKEVANDPTFIKSIQKKGCYFIGFWQCPNYQWPLVETLLKNAEASSVLLTHVEIDTHYKGINEFKKKIESLTNSNTYTYTPQLNKKEPPKWVIADNPQEECEWICQNIRKKLSEDNNLSYNDFTIICSNINSYPPIFHKLLKAYHIPCHTQLSQPLYLHPLYRCLSAFIKWIETPDTIHFIKLLSTTNAQELKTKDTNIPIQPIFFKMIEEYYGHQSSLDSLKKATELYIHKNITNTNNPDLNKNDKSTNLNIAKSQLQLLEQFIEIKKEFKETNSPEKILTLIQNLLLKFKHNHDSLNTIMEESQKVTQYFNLTSTTENNSEFYSFLLNELSKKTITISEPNKTGIHIIGKFESFCFPQKHTYIVDCTAGSWPKTSTENLFFSELELEKLGWPNKKTYKEWDELLFFSSIKQAEQITLTTPEHKSGSPTLPSPYITKIKQDNLGILDNQKALLNTDILIAKTYLKTIGQQSFLAKQPISFTQIKSNNWENLESNLKKDINYKFNLSSHDSLTSQCLNHIKSTSFSPTRLEKYQKCPSAYYFQYILKEHPINKVEEDISQALWGQFIHTLLQKIGEQVLLERLDFKNEFDQKKITQTSLNITRELLSKQSKNNFLWEQKEKALLGTNNEKGLIHEWLKTEFNDETPLKPINFEKTVYTELNHPNLGTIQLQGTLDVILEDSSKGWIAILDYKTGKNIPTITEIKSLYNLQIPIYQYLLKKEFPTKTFAASFIMKLHSQHDIEKKCIVINETAKKELLTLGRLRPHKIEDNFKTKLESHLHKIFTLLQNGYFSPDNHPDLEEFKTKRKETCKYCTYKYTCHYKKRFDP